MRNAGGRAKEVVSMLVVAVASALAAPASADAAPANSASPSTEAQAATPSDSGASTESQGASPAEPNDPGPYDVAADTDPSALTDFREALDGHGTWEQDPTYGLVWVPDPNEVGVDFAPYATGGHWGLDDGGEWIWVSDYDWGWAAFHYGRWGRLGARRWGWIPGRVYAPAWVVWRTGYYDGYYVGWAPMPPSWYWRGGLAVGLGFRPSVPFFFCASHHVFAPHVFAHIVPPASVGAIAVRTQSYVAATASVAGGSHPFGATRGPSLAAAHVPASAVPAQRAAPDARALAFARASSVSLRNDGAWGLSHSTTLGSRYTTPGFNRPRSALPPRVGPSGGSMHRPSVPPAYRAPWGYATSPGYRSAPSYGSRVFTSPSGSMSHAFGPSPSFRGGSFGSVGSSPSFRGGSSFGSGGSSFRAAPSFRGGGGARHR